MTTQPIEAVNRTAQHQKQADIIVNGTEYTVDSVTVSYEEVVKLAYPTPPGPDTRFTVTYRKAKEPHEGSLAPGQSVEVKHKGTIFNVTPTTKS